MSQVHIFCPNCGWDETVDEDSNELENAKELFCDDGCNSTLGYDPV